MFIYIYRKRLLQQLECKSDTSHLIYQETQIIKKVFFYMNVFVHYTYTCIYIYICIHVYVYIFIYLWMCVHIYVCISKCIFIYIYLWIHINTYGHIHIYTHMYIHIYLLQMKNAFESGVSSSIIIVGPEGSGWSFISYYYWYFFVLIPIWLVYMETYGIDFLTVSFVIYINKQHNCRFWRIRLHHLLLFTFYLYIYVYIYIYICTNF
jgi:hypothetical protein